MRYGFGLPAMISAAAAISAAASFASISEAQPAANPARPVPVFEIDPDWPNIPANLKVGFVSGIEIDSKDNAWLMTRPAGVKPEDRDHAGPPVMIFDPQGNYVKGWGGPGAGYQWPEREHSAYIDPKGFVWITGNYCKNARPTPGLKPVDDDQLLKFTQDGKFVMQLGHSDASKGNSDIENFNRPSFVQVDPKTNEAFVSDGYGNHRIIVIDADSGKFKRMWGAFGNPPAGEDHCVGTPEPKEFSGEGPATFSTPHTIRLSNDDLLYVVDREYRRIQVFSLDGKFIRQLMRYDQPFARNLAFSPDPDQKFIYTGYGKGIAVIDRKMMEFVGMIQAPGLNAPGHLISTDSKGNLYVTGLNTGKLNAARLIYKGMSAPGRQ